MNTPKIRFKGFEDDWEQRKFSDLYVKVSEKNDLSFGADKIISVANMYFKQDIKESSDDYMKTYNVMRLGDIAFEGNKSKNYAHGRFVENTIGDGIVSHVFDVFRPIVDYDLSYWKYFINNEGIMGRIMARCTKSSTMMTNLVANDFLKEFVLVPALAEQKEIGEYFRNLDHLITLHQRKCDETKQLKKIMLQKMFPKNGEKNPELRFEGFTDDWEQRKLGALMEDGIILEQSDGNHGELYPRSEEFVNEGIPYIAASSISSDGERIDFNLTKYLSMERAIQFRKGVAKNGDVLLAHNATVGPSVMLSMDYEFAILSTSLTLYRLDKEKMSPMFFLQAIRSGYFQKQLEVFMKQTTRSQVPILTQRNLQISYPINKVEQERIGEFLSNIDHLITLHQRKCEKLKELKKYMLQNMFV